MRIDLPDGQWADIRERITHADDKAIKRARVRVRETPETALGDEITATLRVFVKAWNVRDIDGNVLNLDDAGLEAVPMDIADTLFETILPLYTGVTVPNAPTPPSSAG
jgi:hypothetical protein